MPPQPFEPHGELNRGPRLAAGTVTAMRTVPEHIAAPPYAISGDPGRRPDEPVIKTPEEVELARAACKLAGRARDFAAALAKEGVTTEYIDAESHEWIIAEGGYPSPLNYH